MKKAGSGWQNCLKDLLAAADFADHAFLFSGDGDFVAAVEAAQRKGLKVSIVSTIKSNPPQIADELRRAADNFIDLVDLANLIGRPPKERAEARSLSEDEDQQ